MHSYSNAYTSRAGLAGLLIDTVYPGLFRYAMMSAFGMAILPQNHSTENGHVPGWSCMAYRFARLLFLEQPGNAIPIN